MRQAQLNLIHSCAGVHTNNAEHSIGEATKRFYQTKNAVCEHMGFPRTCIVILPEFQLEIRPT